MAQHDEWRPVLERLEGACSAVRAWRGGSKGSKVAAAEAEAVRDWVAGLTCLWIDRLYPSNAKAPKRKAFAAEAPELAAALEEVRSVAEDICLAFVDEDRAVRLERARDALA